MMKNVVRVIFFLSGLMLNAPEQTFAQSGTTGGSLGKTNKSVSGSVKKRVPAGKQKTVVSKTNTLPSYQGTWHWDAKCSLSRRFTGTFILHGQASKLLGKFTMDQPGDDGTIVGGRVKGSRIVIRRKTGLLTQTWDGVISGTGKNAIITGTASHQLESCSFTASR
jgi:hypothetical protein